MAGLVKGHVAGERVRHVAGARVRIFGFDIDPLKSCKGFIIDH